MASTGITKSGQRAVILSWSSEEIQRWWYVGYKRFHRQEDQSQESRASFKCPNLTLHAMQNAGGSLVVLSENAGLCRTGIYDGGHPTVGADVSAGWRGDPQDERCGPSTPREPSVPIGRGCSEDLLPEGPLFEAIRREW